MCSAAESSDRRTVQLETTGIWISVKDQFGSQVCSFQQGGIKQSAVFQEADNSYLLALLIGIILL